MGERRPESVWIINLELTNACNLECVFCDHVILKKEMSIKSMDNKLLTKILSGVKEEVKDGKIYELGLVGLGEPTLDKHLMKHLDIINEYTFLFERISINSNLVSMKQKLTEVLLNSQINTYTFSVNASNRESYRKMMGMDRFNQPGWVNRTWSNMSIRRAHIDVVDARETKGLWMAHICLFPMLENGGPIYGFDIIAGKKKVTGAFHDFSPLLLKEHPLTKYFIEENKWFKPSKERELPDWAKAIFSKGMIAAGNITEERELNQICTLAVANLNAYIDKIGQFNSDSKKEDVIRAQNFYCEHQQQNPHTPRTMKSLGLPEDDIKLFCADNLFPTIK